MGITYLSIARLIFNDAKPFTSESLDKLAQTMGANTVLKRYKNTRYYLTKGNRQGCMALFNGTFVFDKKWYQMLTPEEVLAVGAHEFNHILKKHSREVFLRVIIPAFVVSVIAVLLFPPLSHVFPFFKTSGFGLLTQFVPVSLLLFTFFVSWYLYSPRQRRQETDCDLSAVRFGYGEAMISALTKLRKRYPKSKWSIRLIRTHPPFEQRVKDIRQAMTTL